MELHPHDHSACLSIKQPNIIQAAERTTRIEWTVDACCSDPEKLAIEPETQMLADLVLQGICLLVILNATVGLWACQIGHDAAALYIELGWVGAYDDTNQRLLN